MTPNAEPKALRKDEGPYTTRIEHIFECISRRTDNKCHYRGYTFYNFVTSESIHDLAPAGDPYWPGPSEVKQVMDDAFNAPKILESENWKCVVCKSPADEVIFEVVDGSEAMGGIKRDLSSPYVWIICIPTCNKGDRNTQINKNAFTWAEQDWSSAEKICRVCKKLGCLPWYYRSVDEGVK